MREFVERGKEWGVWLGELACSLLVPLYAACSTGSIDPLSFSSTAVGTTAEHQSASHAGSSSGHVTKLTMSFFLVRKADFSAMFSSMALGAVGSRQGAMEVTFRRSK